MNESVLIIVGYMSFFPPVLLVGDMMDLVFTKRAEPMRSNTPAMQIWLQDFFVLAAAFAVLMACSFDRLKPITAILPVVSITMGFAAAVDITSGYAHRSGITRAIAFIATFAAFGSCPWLSGMLWFLWNRFRARRSGRFFVDNAAKNCAVLSVAIYAIAFVLPLNLLPKDAKGWYAYIACFFCFFGKEDYPVEDTLPMVWAWMANPCFWIGAALLLQGRCVVAAFFAFIAMGLALTACEVRSIAYVVWASSMFVLATFAVYFAVKAFRSKQTRTIV